jgi:hypothetical protein
MYRHSNFWSHVVRAISPPIYIRLNSKKRNYRFVAEPDKSRPRGDHIGMWLPILCLYIRPALHYIGPTCMVDDGAEYYKPRVLNTNSCMWI